MATFPKDHRLLTPSDFNHLRSGASYCNTSHLRFYYKDSLNKDGSSRIGLSVSRKVGNAVQRNLVKRVLREKFRHSNLRDLGKDILVIASPRLKPLFSNESELKESLRHSWAKGEGKIYEYSQKSS